MQCIFNEFKMFHVTGIRRQVLIAICIYIGQMIVGYTTSWSGPILPKLLDLEQSPLPYLLTETEISLVGSLLYVGAIPGPYIIGSISNTKGRRPCLLLGGMLVAISYVIIALTRNLAMLYCGRVLAGFGGGIITVMNLVYIGEIASTHIRGILLTAIGISQTLGSIITFSIGSVLSFRGTTYIALGLCLAFIAGCLLIPETPMYYILKGQDDKLRKVLQELGRINDVDKLIESKKGFVKITSTKDWSDLFLLKNNRRGLVIVVISNILQHCSGIMAVVFFASIIFEMAGSPVNANLSMVIIGCFQLCGSSVTPFVIERAGRKTLLIISSAICSLSMVLLGLFFFLHYKDISIVDNVNWLPLLLLIIFFIGYDFGLGIIPNVLIGEMFTTNVRSKGSAVAMTSSWLAGFLVTTAFGSMIGFLGHHGAFWIFAGTCGCSVIFTIFFVPETKGKTLLEIQDILSK